MTDIDRLAMDIREGRKPNLPRVVPLTPLAIFMFFAGLTDDQLAKLVGRERSTITKIKLGQTRPSLDLAIKIAAVSEGKVPATAYPILKAGAGGGRMK